MNEVKIKITFSWVVFLCGLNAKKWKMERLVIFVWKGIDVTLVCALNRIKTGLECPNNDFNYKIECIKLVELVFDVLLFGTYIRICINTHYLFEEWEKNRISRMVHSNAKNILIVERHHWMRDLKSALRFLTHFPPVFAPCATAWFHVSGPERNSGPFLTTHTHVNGKWWLMCCQWNLFVVK